MCNRALGGLTFGARVRWVTSQSRMRVTRVLSQPGGAVARVNWGGSGPLPIRPLRAERRPAELG